MARYFFDFRQGDEFSRDTVGSEFETAEMAYLDAYKAAEAMWSELLSCRRDPRRCSFEIRDQAGHVLFELPFRELLDSCYDRAPGTPLKAALNRSTQHVEHLRRAHQDLVDEMTKARRTLRQSTALLAKV